MLRRVAGLPGREASGVRRGVLAKGPKPGQELRVDMPAIGPRTVEQAAAAGLAGVVVEAGGVLVLDRAEAIRAADAVGCALYGLEPARSPAGVPPTPSAGRVIGRSRPSPRDAGDIETGLAAVSALAPLGTGAGVVVVRRYILAIEAAEGPLAMLERTAKLRQWGVRWRKAGAMVRRAEDARTEAGILEAILAPGVGAGACGRGRGRAPRTRSGPTRRPRGWRTAMASSWCCARYHEGHRGAEDGLPMTAGGGMWDRAPPAEAEELRLFLVAGEHSGDALGAKLMSVLNARRRGRIRYLGVGGPLMTQQGLGVAVPDGGCGRDGDRRHPRAPADDPAPHPFDRRRSRRGRAQCAPHHRQPRVHAPDRQARAAPRAPRAHHRLRLAERLGVAAGPRAQDARLHRSCAGAAALRARRARAPGRSALQLRRPSARRASVLDRRAGHGAAGEAPGARARHAAAGRAAGQPQLGGQAADRPVRGGRRAAGGRAAPPRGRHARGGARCGG